MKPVLHLDEIPSATRGCVCGRHSLISCISSFSFQLTNSQRITQLHTILIIFYFPLLRPSVVEIHILFIMEATERNVPVCQTFGAKSWNRAQDSVFQAPELMPVLPKGKKAQRSLQNTGGRKERGVDSSTWAAWASPPQAEL